jgi:hypothetical protein
LTLLRRPAEVIARLQRLRDAPATAGGSIPEFYEAEAADEDTLR